MKHPTIPTFNVLKSHKNHRDDQPPFLLTASCEGPSLTSTAHVQLKLKNLSVSYASRNTCRGVVKCHNHFKIDINGQDLLHTDLVSRNPFSWKSKILVCYIPRYRFYISIAYFLLGIYSTSDQSGFIIDSQTFSYLV